MYLNYRKCFQLCLNPEKPVIPLLNSLNSTATKKLNSKTLICSCLVGFCVYKASWENTEYLRELFWVISHPDTNLSHGCGILAIQKALHIPQCQPTVTSAPPVSRKCCHGNRRKRRLRGPQLSRQQIHCQANVSLRVQVFKVQAVTSGFQCFPHETLIRVDGRKGREEGRDKQTSSQAGKQTACQ